MGYNDNDYSDSKDSSSQNQTGWDAGVQNNPYTNQNMNPNNNPNNNQNSNQSDNQNATQNNQQGMNQGNPYYGNANGNANGNFNGSYQSYHQNGYNQFQNNQSQYYNNWNQQGNQAYQTYKTQPKKQKKPVNPNTKKFWGMLAKGAAVALVFGVIGGSVFTGTTYMLNQSNASENVSKTTNQKTSKVDGKDSKNAVADSTESSTTTAKTASSESSMKEDISNVVNATMPSIVAITNMGETTEQNIFGQSVTGASQSAGSGIVVKKDDTNLYIVTNNHVVENSNTLTVQFIDETTASATIKGTAFDSDLAVIQVPLSELSQDTLSKVKVATLGDSTSLKVGEGAIAIGNALGYGQSVTTGVISALNREVSIQDDTTGETITNDLIQTDAAINPGNSGGALLNMKGEVIGINEMKYSDTSVEGMGYSIPISTASPIIDKLISKKQIDAANQAYLGISGVDVTEQIASAYNMPQGVYVASVLTGSAAESAGIKQGDIITKFDGKDVKTMSSLKNRISDYTSGTQVEVVLERSDNGVYQQQTIQVTLGTKPQANANQ